LLRSFGLMALWAAVLVCAMLESALRSASRAKLEELIESARRKRRYLDYLEKRGLVEAFCILVRVCGIIAFVLLVAGEMGSRSGRFAAGLIAVAIIFVGAELPGRFVGRRWSAGVIIALLPPLRWAASVLEPFHFIGQRIFKTEPGQHQEEVVEAAKEEIRVAIEDGATEGALEAGEKEMIEGILEFRDAEVREVMTPRTEMECLEVETPLPQAVKMIEGFRHSRIPAFRRTRDRVVGIVYVKDLLPLVNSGPNDSVSLADVMRPPLFVPETKRVGELLREFQKQHVQIAMVLDEYGGVNGLVTVEDILEEIVGEIEDEYDQENHEQWIKRLSPASLDVDARVHIDEINDLLGTDLPEDEDYDTMGGLVMARFGRVPSVGEQTRFDGLRIKILGADDRRVRRLLLELGTAEHPDQST